MSINKISLQNPAFCIDSQHPGMRRIPQVCGLSRTLKITTSPPSEPGPEQADAKALSVRG